MMKMSKEFHITAAKGKIADYANTVAHLEDLTSDELAAILRDIADLVEQL